jgi:hypothetical protein
MSVNLIIENREPPVPLDVLCREVPGEGEAHAHEGTLQRWCRVGVRGIRLESVLCGIRRCSSREALTRFYERLTRASESEANGQVTPPDAYRSCRERDRAVRAACADMISQGA